MSNILLIYTGGTIGMHHNAQTGALEPFDFVRLISSVPELALIGTHINTMQLMPPIDSSNMSPAKWVELAEMIEKNYDLYDGFVILHGTDTMSYTASALSFMIENLTKPIILTGSQLPIGQLRTDGRENLITSIEIAAAKNNDGRAMVPEVCIYFGGHLLRGNRTTKMASENFNAFESFNYPHLGEAGVTVDFKQHHIITPDWDKPIKLHKKMNADVVVFTLFPGIEEFVLRQIISAPQLKGVILRTYGSGNAPETTWLTDVLKEAKDRGITIVNVSQCLTGSVEMSRYSVGYHLQNYGVVSGFDSTVEAALTKMMCLLGEYPDSPSKVGEFMGTSLRGEITV